jgi:succinoglycan biosynthesis transport protein ExoP
MLQATIPPAAGGHPLNTPDAPLLGLIQVIGFFRRQWVPIALACIAVWAAAAAYLASSTTRYTAYSVLMLDTRRLHLVQQPSVVSDLVPLDPSAVESQLRVVQSREVATHVVKSLGLSKDPEFTARSSALSTSGSSALSILALWQEPDTLEPTEAELLARALDYFDRNLAVSRIGRSYALSIAFSSTDPAKAARVANAVGEAYIFDQLQTRHAATRRAADWLQERIEELRQQATESDRLVLEFRNRSNLGTREAQAELRVLENRASTLRTLHDSFVQRFLEASQQQSAPGTEARVITQADIAPKTYPRTIIVLALAGFVGVGAGCGAAFLREALDRTLRTPQELERALGLACVGILPELRPDNAGTPVDEVLLEQRERPRVITAELGIERHVVTAPFSRFAETMRSIKVAADTVAAGHDLKVIGIVSAVAGEGKTTIAANLAELVAQGGRRALLVDADLRKSSLTERLAPEAEIGLLQVLDGTSELEDVVWRDPTGLDFLPAVRGSSLMHPSEVVGSERMGALIAAARREYDLVVVDLPPLGPVADAKAAARHVDAFLLTIQWGHTLQEVVRNSLRSAERVEGKLIGAVLNKANLAMLRKLQSYDGRDYSASVDTSVGEA